MDLLDGLHSTTDYVIKTSLGQSTPYKLLRGFREGCPSSCAAYNIVHNVGLWLLTKGPDAFSGIECQRAPSTAPLPRTGKWVDCLQSQTVQCQLLGFADDTSALCRLSEAAEVEERMIKTFMELGEKVHPGKTERMAFGMSSPPPGFVKEMRLVGGWFSSDGHGQKDTEKHIHSARLIWRKLYKQLPRLGISPNTKGMVIRSIVYSSLLYGSEAKGLTLRELDNMQKFANRIIRGATWTPNRGGTKEMKGKLTMADLRMSLGLDHIEVYVVQRQLRYLGHVARYDADRLEKQLLGCSLRESSKKHQKMTVSRQYWERIKLVMAKTLHPEEEWATRWLEVAQNRPGWSHLVALVVADFRAKWNSDTWASRHSEENEALRASLEVRGETANNTGQTLCVKCGGWYPNRGYKTHARSCNGIARERERTACTYCNKMYSNLQQHVKICPSRPGAVQKMNRKQLRHAAVLVQPSASAAASSRQTTVNAADYTIQPTTDTISRTQIVNKVCGYCNKSHKIPGICKEFIPPLCRAAPFSHWLAFTLWKRDRYTTPEERSHWEYRCPSCGHMWASLRALAMHRTACEPRRLASQVAAPPPLPS